MRLFFLSSTVPDVPLVPVSVSGDVWVMGDHRLCCGDSTVQTDVDKLMQGERGDLLFTDPPWNVNYSAVKAGNAQGLQAPQDSQRPYG